MFMSCAEIDYFLGQFSAFSSHAADRMIVPRATAREMDRRLYNLKWMALTHSNRAG